MSEIKSETIAKSKHYWNGFADEYAKDTVISVTDFHYGPLIPGDSKLCLLPEVKAGTRCLELGCGGAQNSIFLNSLGAECTALDVAENQIKFAKKLCAKHRAAVNLMVMPMEELSAKELGLFQLIHSVYGLCFSPDPFLVIRKAAEMLEPGGVLIFSLPHPLSAGEPLELDDDYGVFINNGYTVSPDCRYDENGIEQVRSFFHSFSNIAGWLANAGMMILNICEPELADPPKSSPFQCPQWEEYRDLFTHIPGTVIIKAGKL